MFVETVAAQFIATFCRTGGCLMLLPGFSSARVPVQIRVLLALALAAAILPFAQPHWTESLASGAVPVASIIFVETLVGAMLAFSVRIFLIAVTFIATAASAAIGLSSQLGTSLTEGDAEPALATLVSMSVLLTLFALDFHHPVIAALARSYEVIPIGARFDFAMASHDLTRMLADAFLNVLRLGSPFLAFALLANFYIAMLNKLTPNLQIYFVATPAVLVGGLGLLYVVLPITLTLAQDAVSQLVGLR